MELSAFRSMMFRSKKSSHKLSRSPRAERPILEGNHQIQWHLRIDKSTLENLFRIFRIYLNLCMIMEVSTHLHFA
jgi:hypothetical protein